MNPADEMAAKIGDQQLRTILNVAEVLSLSRHGLLIWVTSTRRISV